MKKQLLLISSIFLTASTVVSLAQPRPNTTSGSSSAFTKTLLPLTDAATWRASLGVGTNGAEGIAILGGNGTNTYISGGFDEVGGGVALTVKGDFPITSNPLEVYDGYTDGTSLLFSVGTNGNVFVKGSLTVDGGVVGASRITNIVDATIGTIASNKITFAGGNIISNKVDSGTTWVLSSNGAPVVLINTNTITLHNGTHVFNYDGSFSLGNAATAISDGTFSFEAPVFMGSDLHFAGNGGIDGAVGVVTSEIDSPLGVIDSITGSGGVPVNFTSSLLVSSGDPATFSTGVKGSSEGILYIGTPNGADTTNISVIDTNLTGSRIKIYASTNSGTAIIYASGSPASQTIPSAIWNAGKTTNLTIGLVTLTLSNGIVVGISQ